MKRAEIQINIFCDLDGVLADFSRGVLKVTGKLPEQMKQSEMWPKLSDIILEPGSSRHQILSAIDSGEPLKKRLSERVKDIRSLESMGLLDPKTFVLTQTGKAILAGLDHGEQHDHIVDFYNSLAPMTDAFVIWDYIKKYDPVVLTGAPMGDWAEPQKRKWCARNLGMDVKVLVGMAKDKAHIAMNYMGLDSLNGAILIDDRPKHKDQWEDAGGIWITHINAKDTIRQLKEMKL